MNKIRKGDTVIVLTGKDKGRSGKIIKLSADDRAFVEGVNMVKKAVKPNPHKQQQGGLLDKEASIHLSNLALLNPQTNKRDRVGIKLLPPKSAGEKAKRRRYFKSNNELVDV